MNRKRYSVEQIVATVKQHERGAPVANGVRKLGMTVPNPAWTGLRRKGQEVNDLESSSLRRREQKKAT